MQLKSDDDPYQNTRFENTVRVLWPYVTFFEYYQLCWPEKGYGNHLLVNYL